MRQGTVATWFRGYGMIIRETCPPPSIDLINDVEANQFVVRIRRQFVEEVTPQVTPQVAPQVAPQVTPQVTPEVGRLLEVMHVK